MKKNCHGLTKPVIVRIQLDFYAKYGVHFATMCDGRGRKMAFPGLVPVFRPCVKTLRQSETQSKTVSILFLCRASQSGPTTPQPRQSPPLLLRLTAHACCAHTDLLLGVRPQPAERQHPARVQVRRPGVSKSAPSHPQRPRAGLPAPTPAAALTRPRPRAPHCRGAAPGQGCGALWRTTTSCRAGCRRSSPCWSSCRCWTWTETRWAALCRRSTGAPPAVRSQCFRRAHRTAAAAPVCPSVQCPPWPIL